MWWEGERVDPSNKSYELWRQEQKSPHSETGKRQITETQILSDESEFTQKIFQIDICRKIWGIAPFLLILPYFVYYDK